MAKTARFFALLMAVMMLASFASCARQEEKPEEEMEKMEETLFTTVIDERSLMCEPLIERAPDGHLVCLCQVDGPSEPHPENRVFAYHSSDNGRTWSEGKSIYEDGQAVYATELAVVGNKLVAFITLHSGRFLDWVCHVFESEDNGYTWVDKGPAPCLPDYTFIRHREVLSNGDIIYTYQHYDVTKQMADLVKYNPNIEEEQKFVWKVSTTVCRVGMIVSHDGEKTFERVEAAVMGMTDGWIWAEPHVAEFEDGHLVMLVRPAKVGFLYKTESFDFGKTWSKLELTDIPNPSNKPFFMRLSNGDAVLLHTPNNYNFGLAGGKGKRTQFEAWFTNDGAKTWYRKEVISSDSRCDYADAFEEDGHLYIVQEHFRKSLHFFDMKIN